MKTFLILRLRNAAIAMDQKGDPNMAALLTEAINELEKPVLKTYGTPKYFENEEELYRAVVGLPRGK
jgi:hypothetical protein